ncbi:MAG TPA: hypothetical protein VHB79_38770 [Polyangiaceae bacterium]|nr:hypothetical protein [Polyangiaceae bacterium]
MLKSFLKWFAPFFAIFFCLGAYNGCKSRPDSKIAPVAVAVRYVSPLLKDSTVELHYRCDSKEFWSYDLSDGKLRIVSTPPEPSGFISSSVETGKWAFNSFGISLATVTGLKLGKANLTSEVGSEFNLVKGVAIALGAFSGYGVGYVATAFQEPSCTSEPLLAAVKEEKAWPGIAKEWLRQFSEAPRQAHFTVMDSSALDAPHPWANLPVLERLALPQKAQTSLRDRVTVVGANVTADDYRNILANTCVTAWNRIEQAGGDRRSNKLLSSTLIEATGFPLSCE